MCAQAGAERLTEYQQQAYATVVRATRAAKAQAEGLVAAARRQCDERVAAAQATAAECASSAAAQ
eukprot:COSAG01_NODE_17202_length_1170_cov_4.149393_2_plen_64_part_01